VLLGVGEAALGVFVDRLEERRSDCSTVLSGLKTARTARSPGETAIATRHPGEYGEIEY
jgi:hypothetical protein